MAVWRPEFRGWEWNWHLALELRRHGTVMERMSKVNDTVGTVMELVLELREVWLSHGMDEHCQRKGRAPSKGRQWLESEWKEKHAKGMMNKFTSSKTCLYLSSDLYNSCKGASLNLAMRCYTWQLVFRKTSCRKSAFSCHSLSRSALVIQ
jgi:hypothetical protein